MRSATRRSGLSPCSPISMKLGVRSRVQRDGAAPAGAEAGLDDGRQADGERDERAQAVA